MKIRLGTRDSLLAMWQANTVADALRGLGHEVDILSMKSEGDLLLDTPLPLMGGKGGYGSPAEIPRIFIAAFIVGVRPLCIQRAGNKANCN